MLVTPDSTIELYGDVPITAGREVIFSSPANQRSYFVSKRIAQDVDCTYVRKTGRLKVEHPTSQVSQCNFIGFKNTAFENKWIYARILDYNYINNVTTEITYAIDWFQTHMFDCNFFESQIEREHLSATDWTNAVANPYRDDILELTTVEDIAVGSEDYEISRGVDLNSTTKMILPIIQNLNENEKYYVVNYSITDFSSAEVGTPLAELYTFFNTFTRPPAGAQTIEQVFEDMSTPGSPLNSKVAILPTDYVINTQFPLSTTLFFMKDKNDLSMMFDLMTLAGVTSNVIGVYYLPYKFIKLLDNGDGLDIATTDRVINPSLNPKLARAPYSYLELRSPDNNVKELHYENFGSLLNGDGTFRLTMIFSIYGTPMFSLIPNSYGISASDPRLVNDIKERIDFGNFPQVGYSIDAYLTFLSSVYAETISNTTTPRRIDMIGNSLASVASIIAGVGGLASGGSGGLAVTQNTLQAGSSITGGLSTPLQQLYNESALGKGGGENLLFNGDGDYRIKSLKNGDNPYDLYNTASSAYCNDEYHAGSGGNYLAYTTDFLGIACIFKRLNVSKKNLIKKYFDTYGYKSGRIGVPRVCNYISGSGDLPHFTTLDNKQCTYVKTAGMQIEAPHEVASDYIQNMFDLGCRFIKGD